MVELMNEEANKDNYCDCVPESKEEIGSYTSWHCERCKKELKQITLINVNRF